MATQDDAAVAVQKRKYLDLLDDEVCHPALPPPLHLPSHLDSRAIYWFAHFTGPSLTAL